MAPPWSTAAEYAWIDGCIYTDDAASAAAAFVDARLYSGGRALERSWPHAVCVHLYRVRQHNDAFDDVYIYELSWDMT